MKRRAALVLLACWIPAALAADHRPPERQEKVEYHGVGVINRVEPVIGLINITHGAVPRAGWQPMTRDLLLKPRTLANGLVPGMMIRFQISAIDPLTQVITAVEPVRP